MSRRRGRVVVVASEETARAVARAVSSAGIPAVAVPWARPVPSRPPGALAARIRRGRVDLAVLTSRNAVRFLPRGAGKGVPAAAVGEATARAARRAGFRVVVVGREGGAALARAVASALPAGRALVLRGEGAREETAAGLRRAGWRVRVATAYRMEPLPGLARTLASALPAAAWVLGSPSAGSAVRAALGRERFPPPVPGAPVVTFGATTARSLARRGRVRPRRAASPTPEAVARAVAAALAATPRARGH